MRDWEDVTRRTPDVRTGWAGSGGAQVVPLPWLAEAMDGRGSHRIRTPDVVSTRSARWKPARSQRAFMPE